ncbi:MAG: TolC family protein [Acidobacteria bacterium]|jgi:outer membrane protein TolC|nr:TolC family protein [Acidobacteriota bacterium]
MGSLAERAALAGLVLLGGCVHYQARPIDPAQTAQSFSARRLDDPGLEAFVEANAEPRPEAWPPPVWDLGALTLAALHFHPDLDVARARWSVAQAGRATAGERPNPSVTAGPGYDTTTKTPTPWIPFIGFDIPIETAGKRGHRLAMAAHLSEAARLEVASTAWQVRSRVRSGLVDLWAAEEETRLREEQQVLHQDNVRLLRLQWEAGAISAFELVQARLAADASRLALRDAERRRAEARVRLAEAVGVPAEALDAVSLSFEGLETGPPEASLAEARSQALLHRTDILSELSAYAATQEALQLEIAKQYPDIHLGPAYEYDQGDNKWTLGIGLTLPVFSRNRGPIAEAAARREEAAARFGALQARVLSEIGQALAGYRGALRLQSDAEELVANLRREETTARSIFDLGEIARSDLVALQLQLGAMSLARLDAVTRARQALGVLEDALQSPLPTSSEAWQRPPRSAAVQPLEEPR